MTIHQEITFNASAQQVYDGLTRADQFAALTEAKAEIDPQVGGAFLCFDDMISGITIEMIAAKRLVQAWRVSFWAPGVYSIVRFEIESVTATSAKLVFDHTGFPEEQRAHLEQGWHNKYWQPMKSYLSA